MLHMIIDVDYVVKKARQNSYNGRCECKKPKVHQGKILCGISVYVLVTVIKSARLQNNSV